MRAHRNTDGVRTSFFVTGKRMGVDFGLLSADSRPLTERQLRAVLEPDAWRRTATEYRDLVDARLFGLGRERYAQLLDLLLALRRPLLAKDLDPAKVSDTLTLGAEPGRRGPGAAGGARLREPGRGAEAVRRPDRGQRGGPGVPRPLRRPTCARTCGSSSTGCRRGSTRRPRTRSRSRGRSGTGGPWRPSNDANRAAQRAARRGRAAAGPPAGLKNSEEYKAQGRIEDKRREVLAGAREVEVQRGPARARPPPDQARLSRRRASSAPRRTPERAEARLARRPDGRRVAVRDRRRRLRSRRCRR